MMTRRQALKTTALASVAYAAAWPLRMANAQSAPGSAAASPAGPYTLPPLPYPSTRSNRILTRRRCKFITINITPLMWRI